MFKKLVLAAAFCATASFATWDKFPVLEDHKGETVVGIGFDYEGSSELMLLKPYFGSRFTVAPNLELAVLLPYYVNLSEIFCTRYVNLDNNNGLGNPELMARYQITPFLNVFLDVLVPVNQSYEYYDVWVLSFGAQFSKNFGIVDFGSELGLSVNVETDDDFSVPLRLNFGAEADFKLNIPLTPFVGADALVLMGHVTGKNEAGEKYDDNLTGEFAVYPYVGLKYAITPNVVLQASAKTAVGKSVVIGEDTPFMADLKLKMAI
jgi:hypothetical protein